MDARYILIFSIEEMQATVFQHVLIIEPQKRGFRMKTF